MKKRNDRKKKIAIDKPLFIDVSLWFIFFTTFGFFYSISSVYQDAGLFRILLKTESLNSYLFYDLKEPLFLDFNFHGMHPGYLFLSFFAKLLSIKAIFALTFIAIFVLFYFLIRFKILNFYTHILWLVTCLFLFQYNATSLFLWFQFGLYLIYENIKPKINEKYLTFITTFFYLIESFIFLPGLIMIFFYDVFRHYMNSPDFKLFYQTIFHHIIPFIVAFFALVTLHLTLAYSWFNVPASNLLNYLALPITMISAKYIMNNVSFSNALINNINVNLNVYMVLLCAILIWAFLIRDKFIWIKSLFIVFLLLTGIMATRAESLFFPLAGFFLLHEAHLTTNLDFIKKMVVSGAILLTLFSSLLWSNKNREERVDVGDENVVVSFNDLAKLNFKGYGSANTRKLIIVDLKIIPENVIKLVTNIKLKKIDILLNDHAIRYLEKDLDYEKKVCDQLSKDKYSIFIKSSIHPDQEKWPYRRVYNLWQILKKKDAAARIILF